jgi:hypothetical protein
MYKYQLLLLGALIVALVCFLPLPSSGQDDHSKKFVENAKTKVVGRLFQVVFDEPDPVGNLKKYSAQFSEVKVYSSTNDFVKAVDAVFSDLHSRDLMTKKLETYEKHWKDLRKSSHISKPESPKMRDLVMASFATNLFLAAEGGRCTVTVSASGGTGAVVKCAKAADAESGPFRELGLSTIPADVEKANYVFIAYRKSVETGRTDQKDCTGSTASVEIPE